MNGTLLNPWLLIFGFAAVIPILFHLLKRRNPVRIEWAAMQFLQHPNSRNPVRRNLRQWAMLAVRIALPLLVAVVAATPGCLPKSNNGLQSALIPPSIHYVFVLDDSFSMGSRSDGSQPLEQAILKIRTTIREAAPGDLFTIITGNTGQNALATTTASQQAATGMLNSIRQPRGQFRVETALQQVVDAMEKLSRTTDITETRVVLLSDFAGPIWSSDIQVPAKLSGSRVSLRWHAFGQSQSNIAVSRLDVFPGSVTPQQPVRCVVGVRRYGEFDRQGNPGDVPVRLFLNDSVVAEKLVAVDPGAETAVEFTVSQWPSTGSAKLRANIPDDGLLIDDSRYQTVEVQSEINLLCAEGWPDAARNFVAATQSVPGQSLPTINSTKIQAQAFAQIDASSINVIALCGSNDFLPEQVSRIESLVTGGVGLIISPADRKLSDSWKGLLRVLAPAKDVIQFDNISSLAEFQFDPLDFEHPVTAEFSEQPGSGLTDVPVFRYHQIRLRDDAPQLGVKRILDYANGDPAVLTWQKGRGTVVLTTTPFQSAGENRQSWNQVPIWWSYVPLINNMVYWLFGQTDRQSDSIVGNGKSVVLSLRPDFKMPNNDSPALWVQMPGENNERQMLGLTDENGQLNLEAIVDLPGFIDVRKPGVVESRPGAQQSFAVNISNSEQDLRRADLVQLQNRFREVITPPIEPETVPPGNRLERSRGFYSGLLWFVLLLLVLEPILANRATQFHSGCNL